MRSRLWAAVMAGSLVASSALARPHSDADKLYKDGIRLLQKGDVDGAVERFRLALELDRTAPLLFNLGQAVAKQGHLAEASQLLEEARALAQKNGPKTLVDLAGNALADLDARYPRVIVDLPAEARGARVELDGKKIEPGGEGARAEPGPHEVVVTAEGFETFRESFKLTEGNRRHVSADLERRESSKRAPQREGATAAEHAPIGPFVLGGIGVIALGGATYMYLRVKSIDNDREQAWQDAGCPGPNCPNGEPAHAAELRQDAESKARLGNILVGVGAVAVVGSGVWYFLAKPSSTKREPALAVIPTPGGAWVSGRF